MNLKQKKINVRNYIINKIIVCGEINSIIMKEESSMNKTSTPTANSNLMSANTQGKKGKMIIMKKNKYSNQQSETQVQEENVAVEVQPTTVENKPDIEIIQESSKHYSKGYRHHNNKRGNNNYDYNNNYDDGYYGKGKKKNDNYYKDDYYYGGSKKKGYYDNSSGYKGGYNDGYYDDGYGKSYNKKGGYRKGYK